MRGFVRTVVRFFLTGVATLLPLVVTVFVVTWVVKSADAYVGPSSSFGRFLLTMVGQNQKYVGYLVGYPVVILLIMLLGFLVTRATVDRFHRGIDGMFARIPLIGKIYTAVGQVVELLGNKEQSGLDRFGGVGEISMGNAKLLGLLTSNQRYTMEDGGEYLLVFIPNCPIPATGFNFLVRVEDFHRLDMPIEDLAKLFMSLGLLGPQVLGKSCSSGLGEKVQNGRTIA
ncbi:MAG: DUF502 domain-containing protein [Desulfomonile sp.]|nr:DUF502 domain-containing protein [Deltaproteobacteria bacterium]